MYQQSLMPPQNIWKLNVSKQGFSIFLVNLVIHNLQHPFKPNEANITKIDIDIFIFCFYHTIELRFWNMKETVRGSIRQKPNSLSFVYSVINLASWTHSDPASMIRAWCLVNLLRSEMFLFLQFNSLYACFHMRSQPCHY